MLQIPGILFKKIQCLELTCEKFLIFDKNLKFEKTKNKNLIFNFHVPSAPTSATILFPIYHPHTSLTIQPTANWLTGL